MKTNGAVQHSISLHPLIYRRARKYVLRQNKKRRRRQNKQRRLTVQKFAVRALEEYLA